MAQVSSQRIEVNSRTVGTVTVDGGAVRGEGGPLRPHVVVPLIFELAPSKERTVAVVAVEARLSASQYPQPGNEVCAPVTVSLTGGFPARSAPEHGLAHTVQLRFPVSPAELEALERARHTRGTLELHLGMDLTVAGLTTHNDVGAVSAAGPGDGRWPHDDGLLAGLTYLWQPRVMPVRVSVEPSVWVRDVLPGLGYDRVRLLELRFPPPMPENVAAASEWDKARRALDEGRYDQCVAECRDLLSMWKATLGATNKDPVAEVVARRRRWPERDARRPFLAGLWKSAVDLCNAPHHPEGAAAPQGYDPADARLVLTLTACLAEYVSFGPPWPGPATSP